MDTDIKTIKCTSCDVALKVITKSDQCTYLVCTSCGIEDKSENVILEINDFIKDKTLEMMEVRTKSAFGGNSFIKVDVTPRQVKNHRFKVDLEF